MTGALFWDLDGTLLSTGGKGWPCMTSAAGEVPDLSSSAFSGLTDFEIMARLVSQDPSLVADKIEAYVECLKHTLQPGSVNRFVEAELALTALASRFPTYIVTGNEPRGAKIKLIAAGFSSSVLNLPIFGSSALFPTRIEIARNAASKEGFTHGVFIGDSPNDVSAAKDLGWNCVSVATGHHSELELAAAGADVILSSDYKASELIDAIELQLVISL